ncbi:hypothetical protein SAMN05421803_107164 [Nocardiopsis flavescens]|uniref:Uncharacterized protein n=1 Tax=Nocardiopsis flavescens TaxID=758803 RepID=A0A1M6KGH0_9ACTN|nr:hypothetical protein [Nocardiopsis flavescens]SHJ58028.1 hypothetical protein SAMN05421803_107164 [Nocardiopsis flavescens]
MNIDLSDPGLWVAVAALIVAILAWWQARRSANSDTKQAAFAEEDRRGRLADWRPERVDKPFLEVHADGARRGRIVNSGDELALNVRVYGDRVDLEGHADEVAPEHGVEFEYGVVSKNDETPLPESFEVRVVWDRPESVGGGRRVRLVPFDPSGLPRP